DLVDLGVRQCGSVFGHLRGLALLRSDGREEFARVAISRHDDRAAFFVLLHQVGMAGDDDAALWFGRLMASLAVHLKNGPNVFVIADLGGFRGSGRNGEGENGKCTGETAEPRHGEYLAMNQKRWAGKTNQAG